jgi:hypothetical protein
MKVEQKLSDFSAEKRKRNENMKTKMEISGTEMETNFFGENGTAFFGGTDAETEISISD